jgi:MFS family permease
LNGIAFGILVPYFNTVAIKKVEKGKSTGIMSIMSASQFLGQFSSPLILTLIISLIGSEALKIPYTIGAFLCILLLIVLIQIKDIEDK